MIVEVRLLRRAHTMFGNSIGLELTQVQIRSEVKRQRTPGLQSRIRHCYMPS
jgi:hypothetical protein